MYEIKSDFLSYSELFIPGQKEPVVLLQNLLDSGLVSNYMMYQSENEVRIVGNPVAEVQVSSEAVSITVEGQTRLEPVSDPLKQVESALASLPINNWTAYGYVGFDICRFYFSYSKGIEQPLLYFFVPEIELCITANGVRIKTISSLEPLLKALSNTSELKQVVANPPPDLNVANRETYENNVRELIKAIQGGALHKAIISRSVKVKGEMDILGTYVLGAKSNSSARSYCLRIGELGAVGFSPEIFMESTADGVVVTNPLAGTRPRGSNSEEDARLYGELFTDAKEVKEHALSVWLAQSEIASVCLPETVKCFDFMQVKQYRCVQHLSSRVSGQLQSGKTLWDAIKALFPGVTVSGINKNSALEWINSLEDEPRGIYAGALGWIDSSGASDLALPIRSVYQYGDCIYFNAGAGIVAESVPEREYIESVNKMNTMLSNLVLKSRAA